MSGNIPSRARIESAAARIAPFVRRTPTIEIGRQDLGLDAGAPFHLKLELLQHTGSFKPRGAFHCVLEADVPAAGLVAASGGNHGLGVAHVGNRLGHATEIFVPETIPQAKLERLRAFGVFITLHGERYDDARLAAEARAAASGALTVHAYDHPDVVAGAGTAAAELDAQCSGLDTILVAVGGGGLMGGIAAWFGPSVRVIGVEPERCPALARALEAGVPAPVEVGGIAADSLGATQLGDIAYTAARSAQVQSLLVNDAAVRAAQRLLWNELHVVAEPGGATALAALTSGAYTPASDERVAVLVCGGNTDPGSLST